MRVLLLSKIASKWHSSLERCGFGGNDMRSARRAEPQAVYITRPCTTVLWVAAWSYYSIYAEHLITTYSRLLAWPWSLHAVAEHFPILYSWSLVTVSHISHLSCPQLSMLVTWKPGGAFHTTSVESCGCERLRLSYSSLLARPQLKPLLWYSWTAYFPILSRALIHMVSLRMTWFTTIVSLLTVGTLELS